jgi:hypothetical protein
MIINIYNNTHTHTHTFAATQRITDFFCVSDNSVSCFFIINTTYKAEAAKFMTCEFEKKHRVTLS